MNPQKKSDLYRLALLSKYGGVYMDASYCLVENLDWLINIAQQPTQFIYNRFGELPKVFLFFHPMYGWSY
jgi:mannosyltransferase OCH1-like enzyme